MNFISLWRKVDVKMFFIHPRTENDNFSLQFVTTGLENILSYVIKTLSRQDVRIDRYS